MHDVRSAWWKILSLSCAVSLSAGCATKKVDLEPVFFPADVAIARMQYLTRISNPDNIEEKQSPLLTFLIGSPPPKKGFVKPYGLAMAKGKLYVCDTISRTVHIADFNAKKWTYFSSRNMTQLKKPINLDVDEAGTMYLADSEHGNIMTFSSNLVFTGAIGAPGEMKPVDVKVKSGKIYVADAKGPAVRVYDKKSRELLLTVPSEQDDKDKRLFLPTNIDVDSDGNIYVSDTGAFRVQKYDSKGEYLRSFGSLGRQIGNFARNKGVAVDRDKRLYVVDAAFHACQIFNEEGQLLLYFGEPGTPRGSLFLPAGVIVDYDNNKYFEKYVDPRFELDFVVLVVSQYGPGRVDVYGILRRRQ